MKPIVIALGTRDSKVLEVIERTISDHRKHQKNEVAVQLLPAQTATEMPRDLHALVREACIRAQLIRSEYKAEIGVAQAWGNLRFLYNRGARRAYFEAGVIVSVGKTGPLTIAGPCGCPDEAQEEYARTFKQSIAHLEDPNTPALPEDHLADAIVNAWSNLRTVFPDSQIEFMQ
jgi:hypothetical protein